MVRRGHHAQLGRLCPQAIRCHGPCRNHSHPFLDLFKVHLLGSVADAIQGLGVELKIIPPGCTGLVQPIDVGINKPFKANMRTICTDWLLEQDADTAIPFASRLDVSAWILEAVEGIKKETIVNSWRKTGFSYFE